MSTSKQVKSFHVFIKTKLVVQQSSMIADGHNGPTFYANIDMHVERETCHPHPEHKMKKLSFFPLFSK